eukprot:CAMPEP_0167753634 /NCGR_PEP_ID=MMETSP0110_2-20121227/7824_1 /TAXON_ID=629695 /ORGANISM="Gymnochlora sp., Strain CCMP2014" /LENGTH=445 /DNA_ID=CAMNT_0007639425 /DNA_START=117 /DNA_END=1454 /DNA_ORIENTATION=-
MKRVVVGPHQEHVNKRVLIITDYVPPQTHGIAIRFQRYMEVMQMRGHEVHIFSPKMKGALYTSFCHPDLPSLVNPYNKGNKMSFNAGVKLAWYLGAYHWDVVHLVYPSLLGWFVLPLCAWRTIPTYCSHHVDMELYFKKYTKGFTYKLGVGFYWILFKFPAQQWGTVNASMTTNFLDSHLPLSKTGALRTAKIPTGVQVEKFRVERKDQAVIERKRLCKKYKIPEDTRLFLMVQRLAPEKDTHRILPGLRELKENYHLLIVGHGPSEHELKELSKGMNVTFTGRVPNSELPPLYRAADAFVTCSRSETYGLTVLEALACGTPVAMPHCSVFDELWNETLPKDWMFTVGKNELPRALKAVSDPKAKQYLAKNPVKASWTDATDELLKQYEDMIQMNEPVKRRHKNLVNFLALISRGLLLLLALFVSHHEIKIVRSTWRMLDAWIPG